MAWNFNHNQQNPFWDFVSSFDQDNHRGAGIDHAAAAGPTFPQGPFSPWDHHRGWGWGGRGRRDHWGGRGGGRRHHSRGGESGDEAHPIEVDREAGDVPMAEKDQSPATVRDQDGEHPDPPEVPPAPHPSHHHPGFRGRGGCGRRGGMRGHHGFGGRHGPDPHRGPGGHHHGPPPRPHEFWGPMMEAFSQHPIVRGMHEYFGNQAAEKDGDETFTPPVDVFSTPSGWSLHISLPGAKKEDVGVNWDADKKVLAISGLVYRPGTEEFLAGMVSGERKVGLFSRDVKLPPEGSEREKEEIDSDGITARMEDGILMVNVPVLEKEWTEIRKVDIE